MNSNKKAISPIITVLLIIFVVIIAVINFETWFNNFNSVFYVETEKELGFGLGNDVEIINVNNNVLYLKNNIENNLLLKTIRIGSKDCNLTQNLSLGINNISIANCLQNINTSVQNILIITEKTVVDKAVFVD